MASRRRQFNPATQCISISSTEPGPWLLANAPARLTLALKDGKPYMAFGTPGGDQQDQWIVNFFLRHVHGGMNLQQSIDAPIFRTTHFPSSVFPRLSEPGCVSVEGHFSDETVADLRRRGHEVGVMDD